IFKNKPVQGDGTIAGSSAGYHGYWITDFTQVDPHFGTNAELRALINAAHARGIKVFFDIIVNHTADVIAYQQGQYSYRNKTDFPYKDANGNVFDDAAYAGTDMFPPLDPNVSFPYTPIFRTPADATIKRPAWLNDRTLYHNRGDSTFSGESSLYGDFFGLDDLFTEHPRVVDGMIDIYTFWISEFGVDGFRIDTVKHVNMEFWQKFAPAILNQASRKGIKEFFTFGEVFSGDVPFLSEYTTKGRLPAVLDFAFQGSARSFASRGEATNTLRDLFAADDYYTDADSNAYSLPTFLGNHDIGRFSHFLDQDNPGATDAQLLARDRLAHALMYFVRGEPIVYYGDEQGFTGDGGDKDAREDMFPSQVASYNDNDLIGTDATTADANFDTSHPLYQSISAYARLRKAHKALNTGAQIHRYSSDAAGIYAFSRIDRDERVEYVLAFNNAETPQTATFKTYRANTRFKAVYPADNPELTTSDTADITVTVPPLSFVIYKAQRAIPKQRMAPGISLSAPTPNQPVTGRVEVAANLDADRFAEVTFAVKVG
ncbi:MAG TPA: alpha-amylase family glycosyl hydrolase, partial [Chthoniobacterales bacterium]